MTRSTAREIAVQLAFELEFQNSDAASFLDERLSQEHFERLKGESPLYAEKPSAKQSAYIRSVVEGVCAHQEELDALISRYSVGWNLSRISSVARAVMRVAIFECLYVEDVPTGVAIGEAVRILKEYEDEDVVGFANGILGSFAREECK